MILLPLGALAFSVPWRDVSKGIGNISVETYVKNKMIGFPSSLRVFEKTEFIIFPDVICSRLLVINNRKLRSITPSPPQKVKSLPKVIPRD